jgi:hypothetical protein
MMQIHYREGYEYQLAADYMADTGIPPPEAVGNRYLLLSRSGQLIVKEGYAWDGASWALDTKNFMRGSLEHDAFYQLMREGLLPPEFRILADARLRAVCREDGMSAARAWWVYQGVRIGGAGAIKPRPNETLTAPDRRGHNRI